MGQGEPDGCEFSLTEPSGNREFGVQTDGLPCRELPSAQVARQAGGKSSPPNAGPFPYAVCVFNGEPEQKK